MHSPHYSANSPHYSYRPYNVLEDELRKKKTRPSQKDEQERETRKNDRKTEKVGDKEVGEWEGKGVGEKERKKRKEPEVDKYINIREVNSPVECCGGKTEQRVLVHGEITGPVPL